jgi:hypothetical protein
MPSLSTRLQIANLNAQATKLSNEIDGSWTAPSSVLSASVSTSTGATPASIDILAHERRYPDTTTTAVSSGTITGLLVNTDYAVYYTDTTRRSTSPTVLASTDLTAAANNFVAGRHFVGNLITPSTAGGTSLGGTYPPGGGGGYTFPGQIP